MFQKIINFIKYHNAFAIIFMIIFVGFSLSLAASPEFRENFISSEETVRSVDNSGIIAADLENFDFGLQIKTVTEDAKNYYITYTYKTYAIQDYIWQEVEKEKILTVSKEALSNRDLGLYIAEELGEVIDYELAYLKEVQKSEKENGLTQKIATIQYAGLIGRFLSPKEKVFPGYEPVVSPPEIIIQPEPSQPEPPQSTLQAELQFEPVAPSSDEPLQEATSTVATSTQTTTTSTELTTATSTTTNNSSTTSIDSTATTTITITELPAATSTTEFPVPAPTAPPQPAGTSTPGS